VSTRKVSSVPSLNATATGGERRKRITFRPLDCIILDTNTIADRKNCHDYDASPFFFTF
jgi:hypothetical protein